MISVNETSRYCSSESHACDLMLNGFGVKLNLVFHGLKEQQDMLVPFLFDHNQKMLILCVLIKCTLPISV